MKNGREWKIFAATFMSRLLQCVENAIKDNALRHVAETE
jgi:hypothetical protein